MLSTDALIIRKFSLYCKVDEHDAQTQSTLFRQEWVQTYLVPALQAALQPMNRENDTIVLIKSLELNFDIDLALSESCIAEYWAAKITGRLLEKMRSNNSQQLVLFRNRPDYLAYFLQDLTHGCAWQRWYYSEFSGLKHLPLSAALRTAILDQFDIGMAALRLLTPSACAAVLHDLTHHDARQIADRLRMPEGSAQISRETLVNTLQVCTDQGQSTLFADNSIHQILYLAVQSSRFYPGIAIKDAFAVAEMVPVLRSALRQCGYADAEQQAAFRRGNFSGLLAECTGFAREKLLQVMALPEQQRRLLAENVMQTAETPSSSGQLQASAGESEFSRYGNAFLLLPYILQLPLAIVAEYLQAPAGEDNAIARNPAAILRLLVISACQGAEQFAHAFRDPLLRKLCGIKGALTLQEAVDFINKYPLKSVSELLIAGIADREKNLLLLQSQCLVYQDVGLVITEDSQKGRWLQLLPGDNNLGVTGDETLTDTHYADLKSLWLLDRYHLNASAALLLMQLAQIALKDFACRLPGFAKSSVPYLHLNFLAMSAIMIFEEKRVLAVLSKVPLNVILNITGIVRQCYTLAEFDNRPVQLCQQE